MPYSTVVSGTVITASWANANVRDQVVTPFGSAAARTSAITAPVEGMLTYRTDAKRYEGYDGSSWVPVQMRAQARKANDLTVNNSTTLVSDTELQWAVQANAVYTIDVHLRYSSGTVPDAKMGWSIPLGAAMTWSLIALDTNLTATITGDYDQTSNPGLGGNNPGALWTHATGNVITFGAAGTVAVQFAQFVANASNTILHAYSYGYLTRIA